MARNFWGSFLILQISELLYFAELIFAVVKDWFFFLGINFCDFQEVAFIWNFNIFGIFIKLHAIDK